MTAIKPVNGIDPSWYFLSTLKSSEASKNFHQLAHRVSKFDAETVFSYYSICAWTNFFQQGSRSPHNSILSTHSTFIAALSLGICRHSSGQDFNEATFRILVGELFELPDSPDDTSYLESDLPLMEASLKSYASENPEFLKLLYPIELSRLYSFLTMSRVAFLHSEGIYYKMGDFVRSALVYEEFKTIAVSKDSDFENRIKRAEQVFLGTTLEGFLRAAWLIYYLSGEKFKSNSSFPPTFELGTNHVPDDALEVLGISNAEIDLVLLKLSKSFSSYQSDFSQAVSIPTLDWVSLKELWNIYDYPVLELDYLKGKRLFAVLDPWKFLRRIITYVQYEIFDYFELNKVLIKDQLAYNLRGDAFERYMHETAKSSGIRKISEILPDNYIGKKCDFFWAGKQSTVLFEAKNKLRPNGDHTFIKPSSLISTWDVLLSAVKQATATIDACNITTPCALVIVTAENHAEVVTQFVRVAKQWKFLDSSRLSAVAVFTITQFEHMCKVSSPDGCYDAIKSIWDNLDPLDIRSKYHNYESFFNESILRDDQLEHIRIGWEKIIPGFSKKAKF